jgi:hypothetical protein
MSDEALQCLDCKVGYTEKDWKGFREKVVKAIGEGKWESARELEKGCWVWAMRVQEGEVAVGDLQKEEEDALNTSTTQKSSGKAKGDAEPTKGRGKRTSLSKATEDKSVTQDDRKGQTAGSSVEKTKRRRTKA